MKEQNDMEKLLNSPNKFKAGSKEWYACVRMKRQGARQVAEEMLKHPLSPQEHKAWIKSLWESRGLEYPQ